MVKGGVRYSAAGFHSLLVPIDLSPASDRVVGRVAQLPLAEGCRITLLHVTFPCAIENARRSPREKCSGRKHRNLAGNCPAALRCRASSRRARRQRKLHGTQRRGRPSWS